MARIYSSGVVSIFMIFITDIMKISAIIKETVTEGHIDLGM